MAINALNTSTLSVALTSETNNFTVGSTANISVDDLLVIRDEVVKVQAIPVSGRVHVLRGFAGTEARAQKSGQRFFILANPHDAKVNAKRQLALVGASGTYPDYLFPGQRAFDGAGNEYILLELTATYYAGTTVLISRDGLYTATVLASGDQGSLAVTTEEGSSDQYVWGQIYGRCDYAQLVGGSSLCTSTGILQPATSVSTPAVGLLGQTTSQASSNGRVPIFGMFPLGTTTTGTTSATSATGYSMPVWLNYPFVTIEPAS